MAAAAGLPLAGEHLNAGEGYNLWGWRVDLDALQGGVKEIILGLGEVLQTEGGAGALGGIGS